jgi:hypothetical protein
MSALRLAADEFIDDWMRRKLRFLAPTGFTADLSERGLQDRMVPPHLCEHDIRADWYMVLQRVQW